MITSSNSPSILQAKAIMISEKIQVSSCISALPYTKLFSDRDEVFYHLGKREYLYIFQYGVLSFLSVDNDKIASIIGEVLPHSIAQKRVEDRLEDSTTIRTKTPKMESMFDGISIGEASSESIRLILLNLAQSVALDHYIDKTEQLLEDTRKHTTVLEKKGRMEMNGKKLKKYIGKVLNIRNSLSEQLYIFDSPETAGQDQQLNMLNEELKKTFDLKERHQIIQQQLQIIKENLELFKDIMFHRHSSSLEWIIILLIVVEVIDLFILKMMG